MNDKPDIVAVLAKYGVEVPAGRRECLILCPAHSEDRPSCSVNTEKGLLNCHACNFAGDAFTLVMLKESCDYPAALQIVEGITGESYRDVRGPARPVRVGLSGRTRPYKPKYRNTPARSRPLSDGRP